MTLHRRAKIVATIGPATRKAEDLKKAILTGMNVARLNFSHGTHQDHLQVIKDIRRLSLELNRPVAILQDLQGPKIRVGRLKNGVVQLVEGQQVRISTVIEVGDENVLSTDFKELPQSCRVGTKILLDDGLLELLVVQVKEEEVVCKVVYGGELKERKGMNLPGASLPVNCLTEKDLADLEFGLENGVDYIALSFVRQSGDINQLRALVEARKPGTRIVAKIEMLEALQNLNEIIAASDAIMVARGDLAVEVGQAQLALWQKQIIQRCNDLNRPVITATQMLDSMVDNPRPTRAEITDIANAVIDGTDALMLSAETASGRYPFKCIETMHEIISEVEKSGELYYTISLEGEFLEVAETIAVSASLSALKLNAPIVVCLSTTGKTAVQISRYRPKALIIAATHVPETLNRLELIWGINTLLIRRYKDVEEAIEQIKTKLLAQNLIKVGERFIVTMGLPVAQGSKTNTMRVFSV